MWKEIEMAGRCGKPVFGSACTRPSGHAHGCVAGRFWWSEERLNVLETRCPTCKEEHGRGCSTPTGWPTKTHKARLEAAAKER